MADLSSIVNLFQNQRKTFFYHTELSDTSTLCVYDKNSDPAINYSGRFYVREIDTTDPENPVVGAEQGYFTYTTYSTYTPSFKSLITMSSTKVAFYYSVTDGASGAYHKVSTLTKSGSTWSNSESSVDISYGSKFLGSFTGIYYHDSNNYFRFASPSGGTDLYIVWNNSSSGTSLFMSAYAYSDIKVSRINSTTYVMSYHNTSQRHSFRVFTISGTTVTLGAEYTPDAYASSYNGYCQPIWDGTNLYLFYNYWSGSLYRFKVDQATFSGTTITGGTKKTIKSYSSSSSGKYVQVRDVSLTEDSKILLSLYSNNSSWLTSTEQGLMAYDYTANTLSQIVAGTSGNGYYRDYNSIIQNGTTNNLLIRYNTSSPYNIEYRTYGTFVQNIEYETSGSFSLSSTSTYDQPKEYTSSGSFSLDSTSITNTTPNINYSSDSSIELDSTSEYNWEVQYTTSGTIELDSVSSSNRDYEYNSDSSMELSSTSDSYFVGSFEYSTSGSIQLSTSVSYYRDNAYPRWFADTQLYGTQYSPQYIFETISIDDELQLVVYDEKNDSGATIKYHVFDTSDPYNPVYVNGGNIATSVSYVGSPVRIQNGLVKHSDSVYGLYVETTETGTNRIYGCKIAKSGNTFSLISRTWVTASTGEGTAFSIDSDRVGIVGGSSLYCLKWTGSTFGIEDNESLGFFNPDISGKFSVTRVGSLHWLFLGQEDQYTETRGFLAKYTTSWSLPSSITPLYFGSIGVYNRTSQYPLKATYHTDGNILVYYYDYASSTTRVSQYTLNGDFALTLVETKTFSNRIEYMSGALAYDNNIDILVLQDGIYSYKFATNYKYQERSIAFTSSLYEQNAYEKINDNIVTFYRSNNYLRASFYGTPFISKSYSTSGTLELSTTSITQRESSNWSLITTGTLELNSVSSYYKETSFVFTSDSSFSIDSTSLYTRDYSIITTGTLELSSTSLYTFYREYSSITSGTIELNSTILSDWTSDHTLVSDSQLDLYMESLIDFSTENSLITSGNLEFVAYPTYDWDSIWDTINSGSFELDSTSISTIDQEYISSGELFLLSESEYNVTPQFTLITEGTFSIHSTSLVDFDRSWSLISDSSLLLDSSRYSDFSASWTTSSDSSFELSSSSLYNFLRSWSYTDSGNLSLDSDSEYWYLNSDDRYYNSSGSFELASEVVYDFATGFIYTTRADIELDSFAESLWTAIFEKTTSGTFSLSSASEYYKREIRPLWEYTSTGALIVSSVSKYSEGNTDVQIVYFKTPITTNKNLFTKIDKTAIISTAITNQVEIRTRMLDDIYEKE